MKVRLTVSWSDFALGMNITWGSRIAFGLGPILLGIYWGPEMWRYLCPACGEQHHRRAGTR